MRDLMEGYIINVLIPCILKIIKKRLFLVNEYSLTGFQKILDSIVTLSSNLSNRVHRKVVSNFLNFCVSKIKKSDLEDQIDYEKDYKQKM